MKFLLKRTSTANKRPVAANMSYGELNLNYDASTGGLFYKNSAGGVVKVGPCQVGATAPNSSPAGSAGNSAGEFWYDTANSTLKVYDGSAWVETGGAVQGVTGTAPIQVDNTDPLNPVISVDSATTSSEGVVQLSTSTSSTSTTEAATPSAVKDAYDLADAALPKSGGTMTGTITFDGAQTFPVSGIQDATTVQKGVVQIGTNIQVAAGVISVESASTTVPGIVQLNDTLASTSTTEALTAAQGKNLQDQIDALVISSNLTFAGTIDASTGDMVTVTTEGGAAGFAVGDPLPAAASGNDNYFVIVTIPGTMTPPGGSPQACHQGDWWLSNGTSWEFLDVGFNAPYASTSTPGVVQLATDAEVQAGLNTDHAVTPSGLQSKVSDSTSTTSSTTIASSTAVKSAYDLADAALPESGGTMTGDITMSGAGVGIVFNDLSEIDAISDSTSTTSSTTAASSTAVKAAYDLADAALPESGGTMTGDITMSGAGVGIVFNDLSEITAISDSTSTTSSTTAASSTAVKSAYDLADAALPKAGGTMTGTLTVDTGADVVIDDLTTPVAGTSTQLVVVVEPGVDGTLLSTAELDGGTY
jgi:hypothetical protein